MSDKIEIYFDKGCKSKCYSIGMYTSGWTGSTPPSMCYKRDLLGFVSLCEHKSKQCFVLTKNWVRSGRHRNPIVFVTLLVMSTHATYAERGEEFDGAERKYLLLHLGRVSEFAHSPPQPNSSITSLSSKGECRDLITLQSPQTSIRFTPTRVSRINMI